MKFSPKGLHRMASLCLLFMLTLTPKAIADNNTPQLLFHASADESLVADIAGGEATPNFVDGIELVDNGVRGKAIEWSDSGILAWNAPGNIYAQRGTLAFFWRSRYAVSNAPFVIFRVGYADHSSWDMAWMRIDWNGEGFEAFVTDANLAQTRISYTLPEHPKPDEWLHLAFSWDETQGVRLYINGREVARKQTTGDYDTGLDQFGLAGRVLSPHQVQSRYNFLRGSDFDEIRIYDRMLDEAGVSALIDHQEPTSAVARVDAEEHKAWLYRYGWQGRQAPPVLSASTTRIRHVAFTDVRDQKQWMWKGTDGIMETTWPGVYNRSRLPGRNDYFQLPDWNTYVEGGWNMDLTLPSEPINRIEIRGAAFGDVSHRSSKEDNFQRLFKRPEGGVRTVNDIRERTGGYLRLSNAKQETPVQQFWAYHVSEGNEPKGVHKQVFHINSLIAPDWDNLANLRKFIDGRYPEAEQATVVALPHRAMLRERPADELHNKSPIVHVLIPSNVSEPPAGNPLMRSWSYTWENMYHGLDGIAIDIPALDIAATHRGLIPLNIRIKDPIWPDRDMINVSVSVRPGQARTVWLDFRDRILTDDSLYLTIASASPEFSGHHLDGAEIRLVYKERKEALVEHIEDRFNQVKDNWGFLVEEHTTSKRQRLYLRAHRDVSDLLRVAPDHELGRTYWTYMSYRSQGELPFTQPEAPEGVPLWAWRQTENLKLVRHFINWWIDERQVEFGDFGGGISDDSDMVQQWPGVALMGVDPEKINDSLLALADAAYKNDMFTDGLNTIETDELHVYEEGINTNSAAMLTNWGDPLTVHRLMETVNAFERIMRVNPQGNMLFYSNWFSGSKIYDRPNWQWQKPYSFPIVHPALLLGDFNNDPKSRHYVLGLSDGYLAHAYTAEDGQWVLPNEIHWPTGETRGGEMLEGSGGGDTLNMFWAAWRWTGDDKYLDPIRYRVARGGPGTMTRMNENLIDLMDKRDTWGKELEARTDTEEYPEFAHYIAWENTGDKRYLEAVYGEGIRFNSQRMYMMTEGHWWSDRVEAPSDMLQRARLGGVALRRNRLYPGHTVSWEFDGPDDAVNLGILIPRPSRDGFKVIAHNLSDKPVSAVMTGWNVTAGTWQMTSGIDTKGDDQIHTQRNTRRVTFEKSAGVDVTFPPGQTLILDMQLLEPTTPTEERADLAIGRGDVQVERRQVALTVHSLGAKPTQEGVAVLLDATGKELSRSAIPPMAAPKDLQPVSTRVILPFDRGDNLDNARVTVFLPDGTPELTQRNNTLYLP